MCVAALLRPSIRRYLWPASQLGLSLSVCRSLMYCRGLVSGRICYSLCYSAFHCVCLALSRRTLQPSVIKRAFTFAHTCILHSRNVYTARIDII